MEVMLAILSWPSVGRAAQVLTGLAAEGRLELPGGDAAQPFSWLISVDEVIALLEEGHLIFMQSPSFWANPAERRADAEVCQAASDLREMQRNDLAVEITARLRRGIESRDW